MDRQRITILGAGSWGTALAIQATRNHHEVIIWGHNTKHVAALQQERINQRYLPGITLPDNLIITDNLKTAVEFSDLVLLAVPSHAFAKTLVNIKADLKENTTIAWATKGLSHGDSSFLHQLVISLIGQHTPMAVLSGPTFAMEVAQGLPSAITIASQQQHCADQLARIFHNAHFRTYTSTDIIGTQIGGATKNVLAIAAGIADGLGYNANTRSALITRGLAEIIRLGQRLGGRQETFIGLAGLGDLILTCTDNQSRNRRFGIGLGQGKTTADLIAEINQEIEGIAATEQIHHLSQRLKIDMPITEQIYHILYQNTAPSNAVEILLSRDQRHEEPFQ